MLKIDFSKFDDRNVACIVNPRAAAKKWKRNTLIQSYLREMLPWPIVDSHQDKKFTIKKAREFSRDHDVIITAGGDGTIADVIQGIMDSGRSAHIALGIIPLGSGNAFRKSLGIPKPVSRALKVLAEAEVRDIDLMDIDGTAAAFASIGATAEITQEKINHEIPGFAGHVLASKILPTLPKKHVEVELSDGLGDRKKAFDKKRLELEVLDTIVTKTSHFGYSWKIAPRAVVDDGYLDITFFEITGAQYMLNFARIYNGTFQKTQRHFKAREAVFRGDGLAVQYHGELLGRRSEIRIKVLPKALKVIAPVKDSGSGDRR